MASLRSFALLGLLALSAFANASPSKSGASSCSSKEFWYETKACCLPHGGPTKVPTPPSGKSCPPTNWYWHTEKSCCVPYHEPKPNAPQPQCNNGAEWNKSTQCCEKNSKPTTTSHNSQPSQTPGYPYYSGGNGRGSYLKKRTPHAVKACPRSLEACPMDGLTGGYECVDPTEELRFCGGCPSLGFGQDCTTIKGAGNVGCEQGTCKVYTCALGYTRSLDGNSCESTNGSY